MEPSRRLIGRDEELALVRAFVDRAEDGFASLTLEGEAGIGKSTLWLAAVDRARSRGCGFSRRARLRLRWVSLTPGWATCSRTCSTRCWVGSQPPGGAPSRA